MKRLKEAWGKYILHTHQQEADFSIREKVLLTNFLSLAIFAISFIIVCIALLRPHFPINWPVTAFFSYIMLNSLASIVQNYRKKNYQARILLLLTHQLAIFFPLWERILDSNELFIIFLCGQATSSLLSIFLFHLKTEKITLWVASSIPLILVVGNALVWQLFGLIPLQHSIWVNPISILSFWIILLVGSYLLRKLSKELRTELMATNQELNQRIQEVEAQKAIIEEQSHQIAAKEAEASSILHTLELSFNLAIYGLDGEVLYVNENVEKLTGIPRKKLIGTNRFQYAKDHQAPQKQEEEAYFWERVTQGEILSQTTLHHYPSGRKVWHSVTFGPIFNEHGKPDRILSVGRDVTKEMEQQIVIQEQIQELQAQQTELYHKNQQLDEQKREIEQINRDLERLVHERTKQIRQQNKQLVEYAFFNAHKVRGPLARIMGLTFLLKEEHIVKDEREFEDLIEKLDESAQELDVVVREINEILSKD